jgi:hypothetical protein
MRKIYLPLLLAALLCGCSEDNQNGTEDELLSGTEWTCDEWREEAGLLEPNVMHSETTNALLEYIIGNISDTIYTVETERGDVLTDTAHIKTCGTATLDFGNATCRFHSLSYDSVQVTSYRNIYETYTLPDQKHERFTVQNGIVRIELPTSTGPKIMTCPNTMRKYLGKETLASENKRMDETRRQETFDYRRTGCEIIMTGDDRKWIGELDPYEWTLEFVQIVPEKRELPLFRLK